MVVGASVGLSCSGGETLCLLPDCGDLTGVKMKGILTFVPTAGENDSIRTFRT
jgi:hypothetical protein